MEWYSSQNGRNDTVHEVDLQASKSGQFLLADIKGFGTASAGRLLNELDANCRGQRIANLHYVNPTVVIESSE